jgi:excisionase family DNA binding protein
LARRWRGSEGALITWIGPAEVAARLNVSRATVYALIKSGELRHKRVGLQIRITLTELERFIRG